jgi:hypothetical protein
MSKTTRSIEERLTAEKEAIERAKARMKSLAQKQKKEERKKRTQRLIAIGAEVEHYAGCQITNLDAFKVILTKAGPYIAQSQTNSFVKDQMQSAEITSTDRKQNNIEMSKIKSTQEQTNNQVSSEQIDSRDRMISMFL